MRVLLKSISCTLYLLNFKIAGPFYNGQIHDANFLDIILRIAAKSSSKEFATHDRMVGMLSVISEELSDIPFYYCIPTLNNVLHCNAPPQEIVVYVLNFYGLDLLF